MAARAGGRQRRRRTDEVVEIRQQVDRAHRARRVRVCVGRAHGDVVPAVSVEGPRGAPVPLNAKHARIARRLQMQQRMQEERAAAGGRGFCALM